MSATDGPQDRSDKPSALDVAQIQDELSDLMTNQGGPYQLLLVSYADNGRRMGIRDEQAETAGFRALEYETRLNETVRQGNIESARAQLARLKVHLRSAACESSTRIAKHELNEIEQKRVVYPMCKLVLLDAPSKETFRTRKEYIEDLCASAERQGQTDFWMDGFTEGQEASYHAEELNRQIPSQRTVLRRGLAAAGVVGSMVVTGVTLFPIL